MAGSASPPWAMWVRTTGPVAMPMRASVPSSAASASASPRPKASIRVACRRSHLSVSVSVSVSVSLSRPRSLSLSLALSLSLYVYIYISFPLSPSLPLSRARTHARDVMQRKIIQKISIAFFLTKVMRLLTHPVCDKTTHTTRAFRKDRQQNQCHHGPQTNAGGLRRDFRRRAKGGGGGLRIPYCWHIFLSMHIIMHTKQNNPEGILLCVYDYQCI